MVQHEVAQAMNQRECNLEQINTMIKRREADQVGKPKIKKNEEFSFSSLGGQKRLLVAPRFVVKVFNSLSIFLHFEDFLQYSISADVLAMFL